MVDFTIYLLKDLFSHTCCSLKFGLLVHLIVKPKSYVLIWIWQEPSNVSFLFSVLCSVLSHVWLFATKAPLSMEFSRQEYWSGLPFPTPGDLLYPGIEPCLLHLLHWWVDSLPTMPPGKPYFLSWEDTTHKLGN